MPSSPAVPKASSKPQSPLRTVSTPPPSVSENQSSPSSAPSVGFVLFSVLSVNKSDDGDEVGFSFSDQKFTFPTWWLYLSRNGEGLPSPDGGFFKNPSKICVSGVRVTGVGIGAMVHITWNTGTTSQFPALWLRVSGPAKASNREGYRPRLPAPGGKNPRSGVEQLTLGEERVAGRYRKMLIDIMVAYVEEEWLLDVQTPVLREMVGFVEVELERKSGAARVEVAEVSRNDETADSSDEGSLIDEEVG